MSRKTRYDVDILAAKDKKMKEQENINRDPKIQKLMAEWRSASPSNRWKEDTETIDEYAERYHRKQAEVADKSAQVANKSAQVANKSASQVADKSAYKKTSPSHKGGKKTKKNRRTANKKSRK